MSNKTERAPAALAQARQSEQPQATEKKRAAPNPSAETEALRARRQLRQLKERADKAFATYQKIRNECSEASVKIETGLSAEAKALLARLNGDETNGATNAAE